MVSCVFKGPISVGIYLTDVSLTLIPVPRDSMNSQEISPSFVFFAFQKMSAKNTHWHLYRVCSSLCPSYCHPATFPTCVFEKLQFLQLDAAWIISDVRLLD